MKVKKIKQKFEQKIDQIVLIVLVFMMVLMTGSIWNESAIRDEMPHIVAGYSYLTRFDYRINPEHPPLVKQLCALPLLLMEVNFPDHLPAWRENVNDQWELGDRFLYKSGNNADRMLFWGRIPVIILTILAAWVIYIWTSQLFGDKRAGLISFLLFILSPNIIAHGRYITTDMGVAAFSIFALYSWYRFLKKPSWKIFLIAAGLQAAMHLAKFSSPLFMPILLLMSGGAILFEQKQWDYRKRIKVFLGGFVLAAIIAYLLVGVWYQIFTFKMPLETQQQLIQASIEDSHFNNAGLATKLTNLSEITILRPYVQYLLGFFMVAAHASYGHTTYFLGEVGQNWWHYYYIAYLLKEPIASQLFFAVTIFTCLGLFGKWLFVKQSKGKKLWDFLRKYYVLIGFFCLILGFLYMGMRAKLQLGIRYIVPIFAYFYIILGGVSVVGVKTLLGEKLKNKKLKNGLVIFYIILGVWLFLTNLFVYPHYLAFFNQYIGGSENGWKYMVDSNLDWGQDLIRLKKYIKKNKIHDIKIDYFGGGNLDYYIGQDNYTLWGYDKGPTTGWLAISVNAIQWNSANKDEKLSYHWLTDKYKPVARIGNSIFVYYIEPTEQERLERIMERSQENI
ncbi:MAG: phospholipid carrier-dependent glycosyltransferase [Candidatus Moranbacteria bacterium]|nr:phospholipid carrier-dependent glycosyltransferase [Candidatus Moranbacteria bacterium]